jgi:hypothetical protein
MDVAANRLYSVTSNSNIHTIRAYDLTTLQLLAMDTLSGISGTASNLTRFGAAGLAFRTSNNQVVLVRATFVPEPSSVLLLGLVIGSASWRRRSRAGTA